FDLAAGEYRLAAERDGELSEEALRSAQICDELHAAAGIGVDIGRVSDETARVDGAELEAGGADLDARAAKLDALATRVQGTHYAAVVREEMERTDVARADYFGALRKAIPDGDVRAVAEAQRLVTRNRDSKDESRHLLALARLY